MSYIIVAGMGRCGTTMMTGTLRQAFGDRGCFINRLNDPSICYRDGFVYKTHDFPPPRLPLGAKVIYLFGDPRDIAISVHETTGWRPGGMRFHYDNLNAAFNHWLAWPDVDTLGLGDSFFQWYRPQGFPLLTVRYEALADGGMQAISDFVGAEICWPTLRERRTNWKDHPWAARLDNTYGALAAQVAAAEPARLWQQQGRNEATEPRRSNTRCTLPNELYMKKLYYYFEGGMGDLINRCFSDPHFTALNDYKKQYRSYVRAVLNTHNLQAVELFRHNDGVDEVQFCDYNPKDRSRIRQELHDEGFFDARTVVPALSDPAKMPLSPEDEAYLGAVLPEGPFVVLHPGAGRPERSLFGRVKFPQLLEQLAILKLQAVIVGGPSTRLRKSGNSSVLKERCDLEAPNAVNLIGIANPRLVCAIVGRAQGFIGSLSCYLWAALGQQKPAVCLCPKSFDGPFVKRAKREGTLILRFHEIAHTDTFYRKLAQWALRNTSSDQPPPAKEIPGAGMKEV